MSRSRRRPFLASALAGLAIATTCAGYVFIEDIPPWPGGTVTLELQLGSSPTYSDGSTPNSTAIEAIKMWNPYMARVQLGYVNNSSSSKTKTNGRNNVFFDSQVYGKDFPDGILAIATGRANSSSPIEMDVIVNTAKQWDSYRGYLQAPKYDLRRVLAHEFGHVLGLDHPDEHGEWIPSLMNSHISDTDFTQQDDWDAVTDRYGRGPGNPAIPPTITRSPFEQSCVEGFPFSFYGEAIGSRPLRIQWTKDGTPIPGATQSNLHIEAVSMTDAGIYVFTAANDAGSASSEPAVLVVIPAEPPTFGEHPQDITVELGAPFSISASAWSNGIISYRWIKDGVALPNAIWSGFSVVAATPADAGEYHVVARTPGGSVASESATVTTIPTKPPRIALHPSDATAIVGDSIGFFSTVVSAVPVSYQWTHDGEPIPGANNSYLSVNSTTPLSAGAYRMVATNVAGSATSDPAILTIQPLPAPPEIRLANLTVTEGSAIHLSAWFHRSEQGVFQWYKDGRPIEGATSPTLYIAYATQGDAGEYFAIATHPAGSKASWSSRVVVRPDPTFDSSAWRAALTDDGVVYLLYRHLPQISRFDLASESWLPHIRLSTLATAMTVTGGNVFVAYPRTLVRIDLDTGMETSLADSVHEITEIAAWDDTIFILARDIYGITRLGAFNATSSTAITWGSHYGLSQVRGISLDRTHARLFTTRYGGDITSTPVDANGAIGGVGDTIPVDSFASGTRTFVDPGEARVYVDNGAVFSTDDISFSGTLGIPFESLGFLPDGSPIVLSGSSVFLFRPDLGDRSVVELQEPAQYIAIAGNHIYAFTWLHDGSKARWEKVALADFAQPAPVNPVQASDLEYTPAAIVQARDGSILLYSRLHAQLFRWAATEQRYLTSISLKGRPNAIAYSLADDRVYLGYTDNRLSVIDLDSGSVETAFATAPRSIQGLCVAGGRLVVSDSFIEGSDCYLVLFDRNGTMLDTSSNEHLSFTYAWNPVSERLYHFRDNTLPNDLLYTGIAPQGAVGTTVNSPHNGSIEARPPISISPSGDAILLGSGKFYDADTLEETHALANGLLDAAWLGSTLYTARDTLDGAEIQRWGGNNYALDASRMLSGRVLRIFPVNAGRLVAITHFAGRVQFTLLDPDLGVMTHATDQPDLAGVRLANLSTRGAVETGDNIMIAGFVVTGSRPKPLVLRAVGPGLLQFKITDFLEDPVLEVVKLNGPTLATNDDWDSADPAALRAAFATVGAFPFDNGSRDAALLIELPPGAYTAKVTGKNNSTGVALIEAYDLDPEPGANRLVNISTRALVGGGNKVLIPGLVVDGPKPKRLLVRAVGPTLADLDVAGVLADPWLEVVDAHGEVVFSNDDWEAGNAETTAVAASKVGAFPLPSGSADAALVATFAPGSYTVRVNGKDNTTGVALVEVYEVP